MLKLLKLVKYDLRDHINYADIVKTTFLLTKKKRGKFWKTKEFRTGTFCCNININVSSISFCGFVGGQCKHQLDFKTIIGIPNYQSTHPPMYFSRLGIILSRDFSACIFGKSSKN